MLSVNNNNCDFQVFMTLCRLEDAKAAHHHSEKFTEVASLPLRKIRESTSANSKSVEYHKEQIAGKFNAL